MRKHAGSGTPHWLLSHKTSLCMRSEMEGAVTVSSKRWWSLSICTPCSISGISSKLGQKGLQDRR